MITLLFLFAFFCAADSNQKKKNRNKKRPYKNHVSKHSADVYYRETGCKAPWDF